ncbi:DUF2075 domain-containing protein [Litoribacter alkaliphilus]|uniref:DUF2075 domain-containing protein n=1 Tax=Litoribacter ruber TaxID=702568 RepID=A0AAP2G0S9_9BACT|nr:DUF2075 domain-containing protein [Litoribacter alkaliphilus]MBS9522862.1 DUF2075 domain-containing protein [Litoribacter alkaliphilus]
MNRAYYSSSIKNFLSQGNEEVFGIIASNNPFSTDPSQAFAWKEEITVLKHILEGLNGEIFFEYDIPRMGKRIDVLTIIDHVLFILEFKVGEKKFSRNSIDQALDYAVDLKSFHETSHNCIIAPILIATENTGAPLSDYHFKREGILSIVKANRHNLDFHISGILSFASGKPILIDAWKKGRYSPTPTLIESARKLYVDHTVDNIQRNDAAGESLKQTTNSVLEIIESTKRKKEKAICFVTGVPGAGKTLVGLKVATEQLKRDKKSNSVFLSGNGPLVSVLIEALARDKFSREKEIGNKVKKSDIQREVKSFIQNVHHFRDECLKDPEPPFDHVAIFDEAQRAWDLQQTANFMARKKNRPNFSFSEPEFLISCIDRHQDWGVVICLVGGGQEINTGEAGISEWVASLNRSFPEWKVYASNNLNGTEYGAGLPLAQLQKRKNLKLNNGLHLKVSMRSFRAENLSELVQALLDLEISEAKANYKRLESKYPIVLTRNLKQAKDWVRNKALGTERFGIMVSSQAQRLKPYAIDVKSPINPVHWFLNEKEDIRSSYFLEDVATEFQVQGLELDWACVAWDADFRYAENGWSTHSFKGNKWQRISKEERKVYIKNAYRVLLTRARRGMVIFVPEGDLNDHTRPPSYYDETFEYLKSIGFPVLS